MPSNKNAVIRYMYLDEMLSDRHHYYTRTELYEKCNERLRQNGYPEISMLIPGDSRPPIPVILGHPC